MNEKKALQEARSSFFKVLALILALIFFLETDMQEKLADESSPQMKMQKEQKVVYTSLDNSKHMLI